MPGPLLVTAIAARPQYMKIPDEAGAPDLFRLESGSIGDPRAVSRIEFSGQRVDALGQIEAVVVIVPVLDLLHLRAVVDAALQIAETDGHLAISDQDRR